MLNLTRHVGQTIMVGDDPITVVAMNDNDELAVESVVVLVDRLYETKTYALPMGEMVLVMPNVYMRLQEFKRGQAVIGTKAPRSITIHRLEIYKKIQQEQEKAA